MARTIPTMQRSTATVGLVEPLSKRVNEPHVSLVTLVICMISLEEKVFWIRFVIIIDVAVQNKLD